MRRIRTLQDILDWGLCIGCGACFSYCKKGAVKLIHIQSIGIRPTFNNAICNNCNECVDICPGYYIDARKSKYKNIYNTYLIGPTLEIWEGYAKDRDIRYYASSGGIISALSLYCLEKRDMNFVLHTGADPVIPYKNKTIQSKNRTDILACSGSRYSPSSPCDSLQLIEQSNKECVFIGKPCDAAAISQLCKKNKELSEKIGIILTFFCAGTPSTLATLNLLKKMNIKEDLVNQIKYRGLGWPGNLKVIYDDMSKEKTLTYIESWNFLQKLRPFRCHICPDGLGELADISCGDAWHKYSDGGGDIGRSLILVRSERGKEILHNAMDAGYLKLFPSNTDDVIEAQGLVTRRKEVFGRILAMKVLGIPTPAYKGFSLFKAWRHNSFIKQVKIVLGTLRRLIQRGLWHRNIISDR